MIAYSSPRPILDTAAAIGFRISRDALWSGERCTWLEPRPVAPGSPAAISALCGPTVYGGTAGVGWFLAQAGARTGDPLLTRTARGALRQASAQRSAILAGSPHGFFGGAAGVGAALVLAGRGIGDEQAIADGFSILGAIPASTADPLAMDLVSGLAGTVLAMTVAANTDDLPHGQPRDLPGAALRLADQLKATAARDADGSLSWATMPGCRQNLTGFAHGTAGIAHALLALAALTGEREPASTAAGAILYERARFDRVRQLWPDFRFPDDPSNGPHVAIAWCHGAAGIVRSRLAAVRASVPGSGDEIEAGLPAIVEQAERLWSHDESDPGLCHGLSGLLDTLLDCSRAGHGDYEPFVRRAAATLADRFEESELPLAARPGGERSHGLLLGDAGIGHFLLRLADPRLEPVLAPGLALLASPRHKVAVSLQETEGRAATSAPATPKAK